MKMFWPLLTNMNSFPQYRIQKIQFISQNQIKTMRGNLFNFNMETAIVTKQMSKKDHRNRKKVCFKSTYRANKNIDRHISLVTLFRGNF